MGVESCPDNRVEVETYTFFFLFGILPLCKGLVKLQRYICGVLRP